MRLLRIAIFLLVLGFAWVNEAFAGAPLKVEVFSKYRVRSAELRGEMLQIQAGRKVGGAEVLAMPYVKISVSGTQLQIEGKGRFDGLRVEPKTGAMEVHPLDQAQNLVRRFRGKMEIRARGGLLFFVEEPPFEDYVRSVVAAELPEEFPLEAQKAQAVLVRTYALAKRGRHQAEGFDLCDLTHCQVYAGLPASSAKREEAVRSTEGLILAFQGQAIEALFHSTCGGHTSANQRVFGGRPLSYLQGVSDGNFCAASPHATWKGEIPLEQIAVLMEAGGSSPVSGEIRSIHAADREPEGRVFSLELQAERRSVVPTVDFLSWMGRGLGWNELKSNWFDVEAKDGNAVFQGKGLGHGVGLCQWGARGRAMAGMKFMEILRGYFPKTKVERLRP